MKANNPFFSIIVPVYNRQKFIKGCIESIIDQDLPDFEILVINDGSTDATSSVLSSIKDLRLTVLNTENLGRCSARNLGIEKASGRWICFLDSDDRYNSGYLSHQKSEIDANPEFRAFSCEQTFDGYPRKYLKSKHKNDGYVFKFDDFIEDNPVSLNQLCYSNKLDARFPEGRFENSEDWYFFRRLTFSTCIKKSNYVGVNVNDHQERSVYTTDVKRFVRNNYLTAELIIGELDLDDKITQQLRLFTNLLCSNILLSKSKDKKEALQYFKRSMRIRALFYPNFWKAIWKFILT